MSANVSVEEASRRIRFGQFTGGDMMDDSFIATIDGEKFRVTVTPLCMSRFRPRDRFDAVTYYCADDRDHSGPHADEYGTYNWTDEDQIPTAKENR